MGVNLGDVIKEEQFIGGGGKLPRLESIAPPGGILFQK
ncbi:MAG: hypothetical protein CM15mP124_6840 [Alphaproteobacteria bacterium]|nr:MAG: hypothetical protein CM15mP124_6840 [Alphaproteobacteria bacterium]